MKQILKVTIERLDESIEPRERLNFTESFYCSITKFDEALKEFHASSNVKKAFFPMVLQALNDNGVHTGIVVLPNGSSGKYTIKVILDYVPFYGPMT